jgi:hypothetical protein
LCDENDDTKCRAGYFTGNDCAAPVPPVDRTEIVIIVILCPPGVTDAASTTCKPYDEQTIRLLIASYTSVGSVHIAAFLEEKRADSCCFRFKIVISDVKVGGEIDPEAQADEIVAEINTKGASDGLAVEQHQEGTEEGSVASSIVCSFVLMIAAFFATFM